MHDDGSDVAMSRWLCHAAPGAIRQTTTAVCVFAGRYGSRPPMLKRVTAAVTQALDEIFGTAGPLCAGRPGTVVDAAADGVWLAVRLDGPGRWPAGATEARLRDLADRVEISVDERSGTMTVLFEFPSDPEGTGPCRTGARRRTTSSRYAALSQARRRPRC